MVIEDEASLRVSSQIIYSVLFRRTVSDEFKSLIRSEVDGGLFFTMFAGYSIGSKKTVIIFFRVLLTYVET